MFGIVALLVCASMAMWLSTRGGQPSMPPVYGARAAPAALWTWDGNAYSMQAVPASGPSSNHADMAFDRTRGVMVLWDHGCAGLVMGFQGGCVTQVNRTWTWDGSAWTARPSASSPTATGQGAMLFDARLGQVVYVNGVGQAWSWTGSTWASMSMRGGPSIPGPGSYSGPSTFAAGYDEGRDTLVFVDATATWSWDGTGWSQTAGGIDAGEARDDAHLVYDRAHQELVYVGSRATWTWNGAGWQRHDQPALAAGTPAYDAARATVMLVQDGSSTCDRTGCRTTTWAWDSRTWAQVLVARGPRLPTTRSGAFAMPMAFDEARGVMVLFASGS